MAYGGDESLLPHVIGVMRCESGLQIDPGNPDYVGIGQFVYSTWLSVARAGADWRDPWEQGWAVAHNIDVADERWQWPYCWTHPRFD